MKSTVLILFIFFVGRQSGGGYNGNNGGSFPTITLPNSKIKIRIPAYRMNLDSSSNYSSGIIPDYEITNNLLDSEDKAIAQIFELIENRKSNEHK